MGKRTKEVGVKAGVKAEKWWMLERSAGTLNSGLWILTPKHGEWASRIAPRLMSGKRIAAKRWPSPAPVFTYEVCASLPDVATETYPDMWVVSDRLRRFIESTDPGSAQFFPVKVEGPGRGRLSRSFWCVNWLRAWKCQPEEEIAEIDTGAIPSGERIGVVAGSGWWYGGKVLVDGGFKREAIKNKLVGLRFSELRLADGPDGPHRGGSGRSARAAGRRRCEDPCDRHFEIGAFLKAYPKGSYVSMAPGGNALADYAVVRQEAGVDLRVVRRLIEYGCDVNVGRGSDNIAPMLIYIQPKSLPLLRLLDSHGADWNVANELGTTPLLSASFDADPRAIAFLLRRGASAGAHMLDGSNALHLLADSEVSGAASVKSVLASARLVIAAGALTTDKDDRGRTPGDAWGERFECRFDLSSRAYRKIHGLLLKVAKVLGKPGAGGA